jgi:hypothetical protein
MKKSIFAFLLFSMIQISGKLNAQVIAVINRADWRHVCKENGSKVMNEIMPAFKMGEIDFIINDLTDEKTKESSMMSLEKAGIYNAVKKEKMTGSIVIINKKTGKEIERISVAKPTEEIKNTINKALKASMM